MQLTLAHRFPENSSYKFWMAAIQESLGGLFQERGRLPERGPRCKTASLPSKMCCDATPRRDAVRHILAKNYMNLADVLRRTGEDQAAEEATCQAQEIHQER